MDLFDMVREAPPPKNIRERSGAKDANEDNTDAAGAVNDATSPMETLVDDEDEQSIRQVVASGQLKQAKNDDDDADDNVNREMFADGSAANKNKRQSQNAAGRVKQFVVRVKRMSRSEIAAYQKPPAPKRGRPRKRPAGDAAVPSHFLPSPPKKLKPSHGKVHIKLRPNGGDNRNEPAKLVRAQTPPARSPSKSPIKASSATKAAVDTNLATITGTATTPNTVAGFVSKAMIKRYGKRFFNCVVRVKRLQHSGKRPTNIRSSISSSSNNNASPNSKSNKRKSKSKLSVSFSEAVEIFGSSPRKSSSSSMAASTSSSSSSSKSSVPTRLQRVDAIGNVVEDVELPRLATDREGTTKRSRSSSSFNGREKRSGKSKRSLRVPVSGLASLSIDDSQDGTADNEATDEYIVPNELPDQRAVGTGVRRSGTPNPLIKRVTTTTISDDDDVELTELLPGQPTNVTRGVASSRDPRLTKRTDMLANPSDAIPSTYARPDPAAKKSKSKTPEPQEPLTNKTDKKLAKQTIEPEQPEPPESKDASKSSQPAADDVPKTVAEERKPLPKPADADAIYTLDDEDQELGTLHWTPDAELTSESEDDDDDDNDELEPGEIILSKEEKEEMLALAARCRAASADDSDSDSDSDSDESEPREMPRPKSQPKELVASTPKEKQQPDDNQQNDDDDDGMRKIKSEIEPPKSGDKQRDLISPVSLEVTTDDILEIRTSLEDERDLTLNSPCAPGNPERNRNLSLESPDSNGSFKSAKHGEINEDDLPTPLPVDEPDLNDIEEAPLMSPSTSSAATAQQQHNIFNGADVATSVSSLGPESFSAIDEMPNLDVDDLGQLVEPDFQMSNSRNANSRDTPDDIMKLLES